ncbi:type II toxin-antitoxin system VapC family toxin [Klenkia sp. PcliD-1-E]|uniref:type II toxin-antitoxin system VapC family toxin n=1 Tax=Klenkia sp. PcliD-1-E TaxID=2954492 RepID=UPI0020971EB2|nr:type II toxin-antitoxin system VapC family toxin [Klenkia sp. PcliD-1-E]MCO7222253.1 type II toxin-antitoxin system VapC family toxin [Klenkia sp. PcliD-1-E]
MTVIDSSAVVALLTDAGGQGSWVGEQLRGRPKLAPAVMRFEVANVLRRLVVSGQLTSDDGVQAHRDLVDLQVTEWSFERVSERTTELWPNVTAYDAAYVAMAEALDVPLLTLDERLSRAAGPQCAFLLPPS